MTDAEALQIGHERARLGEGKFLAQLQPVGGGGHPVVGGISFAANEVERARLVAREIAKELAG